MTACYMCRNDCINQKERLLNHFYSLESLCNHLKIQILFDKESVSNSIHLCLTCSQELCNFAKLYGDLEVTKMKIHLSLNNILSAMMQTQQRMDDPTPHQTNQVEELRKEIMTKSGAKLLGKVMAKVLRQNIDTKSIFCMESRTKSKIDQHQVSLENEVTNDDGEMRNFGNLAVREGNHLENTAEEFFEGVGSTTTQVSDCELDTRTTENDITEEFCADGELEIAGKCKSQVPSALPVLQSSNAPELPSSTMEFVNESEPKETAIEELVTDGLPQQPPKHFDSELSSDDLQYEDEWEVNVNIKREPESTANRNDLMEALENLNSGMPWTSYSYAEGLRRIDESSDDESIIELEVLPSDSSLSSLRRFNVKVEFNIGTQPDPVQPHQTAASEELQTSAVPIPDEEREASCDFDSRKIAMETSYCINLCKGRYPDQPIEDHNIAVHLDKVFAHCISEFCEVQHFKLAVERCLIRYVSSASCDFCNFSVGRAEKYKLRRHLVMAHFKEVEENLKLNLTSWLPDNKSQENQNHEDDMKQFFELNEGSKICNICGIQITTSYQISCHLRTHGFDMFKCGYCKESFSRPVLLRKHLLNLHKTDLFQAKNVRTLPTSAFEGVVDTVLEELKDLYMDRENGNKCTLCRDAKKPRIPRQSHEHLIGYHLEFIAGKILSSQIQHKETQEPQIMHVLMRDVPTGSVSSNPGREVLGTLLQQKPHLPCACRFCPQLFPDNHQLADHEANSHCYQLFADCKNVALTEPQFQLSLRRFFIQIMDLSKAYCMFCEIQIGSPAQMHKHLVNQHLPELRTHLVHFQIQEIPTLLGGAFSPTLRQLSFASTSTSQPNKTKIFSYNPHFSQEMKRRKVGQTVLSSNHSPQEICAVAISPNHAVEINDTCTLHK